MKLIYILLAVSVLLFIGSLIAKYTTDGVAPFFILLFASSIFLFGCAYAVKNLERKIYGKNTDGHQQERK